MPFLSIEGATLHYDVEGDGPPMLFCSSTATHGDVWKFHQTGFFSRTHRVITFDQRGTGQSITSWQDFSTKRLAADAALLLAHLGAQPAVVCGHSNGGRVAQYLAVEHPDAVARLVLMSSGGDSGAQVGRQVTLLTALMRDAFQPRYRMRVLSCSKGRRIATTIQIRTRPIKS